MIDALNWWKSLRRNRSFWDWVRDTYSKEELKRLAEEGTNCDLLNIYDPLDGTLEQSLRDQELRQKTARRLLKRYGSDIWSCCFGAGGYDPKAGNTGLTCLSKLDLAFQVYNQPTFEEFLVRNALKSAAKGILEEKDK